MTDALTQLPLPVNQFAAWSLPVLRPLVLAHLASWRLEAAPGALQLAYVTPPAGVLLVCEVAEGTRFLDEIFLRDLVRLIHDIGTPGVVAAVARPTGRASRSDRRLKGELTARLADSPTDLLELLAVGGETAQVLA